MINYLLDPFIQIENIDGLPVVGAKVYVYYTGSRTLAPIYSDKEGTQQNNPAITDTLGNVTIFADTASFYDVFVYDNNDQFLFSKEYVAPNSTNDADVPEIEVEAGFGIQVHKRYQGNKAIYNVAIDQNETATAEELAAKQDKLTAGANIEITDQNVINVVQRKELVTETPLKIQRTSNKIKLYLDPAFYGDFKHSQDEVIIGGGSANYISKITQNENGNVSANVGNFVAGANINIANNNGNLTISGKDWSSDISNAITGKIDKVTGGAGSPNNPVYYDETSGVLPCFTDSQTFMGLNNNYIDGMSGYNNVMYGNSNTYNFSHSDAYAPSSPHYNNIFGYNNNATVSGSNSYLYDTSEIGTNNNMILNGGSNCIIIGNENTTSGTNGGFVNQCGIVGDSNKMIVDPKPGDEYNSTYLNYIFGYKNTISSIGWGCTIFGNENETNARSLSYLFGYRNKINDNQSFDSILFGENNQINATTAETERLTTTCLVGFDNKINASNRTYAMSNLYAFGEGNIISSGYRNFMYGYANTATNTSAAMCFGRGLSGETQKIKYGAANCYLEIDENAGKIYKVINGTRTEI